ncbi:CoxG family protein [Microbaculum marinisediminis]|uniref:Carbon monoxide dehydrogenase subunit G n=1 Tax=Microbaculum marinisediminis TaxID=2931392 RepID=A0AAW5QXS8_9HYPH|nr:carbon monoxide dehydrogenase subunit G [Microbaculum sp. A6E488]MCT8972866.1 carbon monoxide dehydrogenase subunit G [Microbaculum sp. A6E488]
MAMTMTGEYTIPADRQTVWNALNDQDVLAASIPGCESFEKKSDTEFSAVATVKIGPVKAKFKGDVTLSDIDAPNSYRISGQGQGGVAGFAKGGATVSLKDGEDGGTVLTYDVEAHVGGKIAQVGQRLINGAAKKTADQFFENFRNRLSPDQNAA